MMYKILCLIFSILVFFNCTDNSSGVIDETEVIIAGVVKNKSEGTVISGVRVSLQSDGTSDSTDINGEYEFKFIKSKIDTTVEESLIYTYHDTILVKKPIDEWVNQYDTVYLASYHTVDCDLITEDTLFKKIEISYYSNNLLDTNIYIKELGYGKDNNAISGGLFLPALTTNDTFYFQINVFNSDSILSGQSEVHSYGGKFANIKISSFKSDNLKPKIDSISDIRISAFDTLVLSHNVSSTLSKTLTNFEWLIDTVPFTSSKISPLDTIILNDSVLQQFELNNSVDVVFKVTDSDGLIATDTFMLEIFKDAPIANAGIDTTVLLGSAADLHGSVKMDFGFVAKWEWSIGGGDFVETSTGDTTIDMSKYYDVIYCILKVTDNLNLVDYDTVLVYNGDWLNIDPKTSDTAVDAIALYNHKLYISCRDLNDHLTLYVYDKKNSPDIWIRMRSEDAFDSLSRITSMSSSDQYLYILNVNNDILTSEKIKIVQYFTTSWVMLDSIPFDFTGKSILGKPQIITNNNDSVFVAFTVEDSTGVNGFIYSYIDSQWNDVTNGVNLGDKYLDYNFTFWDSKLCVSSFNNKVLTVQVLDNNIWSIISDETFNTGHQEGTSLCSYKENDSTVLYLSYWDEKFKLSLAKYKNGSWSDYLTYPDYYNENGLHSDFKMYGELPTLTFNGSIALFQDGVWAAVPMDSIDVDYGYYEVDEGEFYFVYKDSKKSRPAVLIVY